jgi:hypothetical protein
MRPAPIGRPPSGVHAAVGPHGDPAAGAVVAHGGYEAPLQAFAVTQVQGLGFEQE